MRSQSIFSQCSQSIPPNQKTCGGQKVTLRKSGLMDFDIYFNESDAPRELPCRGEALKHVAMGQVP